MKKRKMDLTDKEYMRTVDMLYTAAGTLRGRAAMKTFLKDLLTVSERIMLGRRIWIARLLLQDYSALEICRKLRVSLRTVYQVERWLGDQFKGYENAVSGLERVMDDRAVRRESFADPFSFAALKHKYPLHFLLFPTPKPKRQYRD
jgi:uncharacterized protein YerC